MPHAVYKIPVELTKVTVYHLGRAVAGRMVSAPVPVAKEREAVCVPCIHFQARDKRCLLCRCWLDTPGVGKWHLAGTSCPLKLWGPHG